VFTDWFLVKQLADKDYKNAKEELLQLFEASFNILADLKPTLMLKDYMADNLMWLDNEEGLNKLGVLDFQDAVIGLPFYDLASLVEDARREVPEAIAESCLKRYVNANKELQAIEYKKYYAHISLQKNLRIIGVFYRKYYRDNSSNYLRYIPTMMRYVRTNLQSPYLAKYKSWFTKYNIYPNEHDYQ
jgi:aminoglycoside/choline kinase family phosphotransferase